MSHRKLRYAMVPACALLLSCSESTDDASPGDGVDQLERWLELRHHEALLARMTAPDSTLVAFTTDGCSGSLSVGWEYLSEHIDILQEKHGIRPSWEACCVAHDRRYHTGATIGATAEESFLARKQADLALSDILIEIPKITYWHADSLFWDIEQFKKPMNDAITRARALQFLKCYRHEIELLTLA